MGIKSIDIREFPLRRSTFGYDKKDVEGLKELCIDSLTEASRTVTKLEDELRHARRGLTEHEQREGVLKDTITTAHKMVDDLKENANREADLIKAEAHQKADEITRHAHQRVIEIQQEISRLKAQRLELEVTMQATLNYHMSMLNLEGTEARDRDMEGDKLALFPNKEKNC